MTDRPSSGASPPSTTLTLTLTLTLALTPNPNPNRRASAFEAVEIQVHSLFLRCYGETIPHYGDTNRRAVPTSKGYSNLPTYQPTSTSTCYQHLALLTYY